jgi:hypothetical protein
MSLSLNPFIVLLKENPALLTAVARFNAPEIGDFDPQALPDIPAALQREGTLEKLAASKAGKVMTRAWIFGRLGAENGFTDFGEERRRLALLGKETLSALALVYGACVHGQEISLLVKKEEVASLRALLGASYQYTLTKGRFQTRKAGAYLTGILPGAPLPERIAEAGFAALRRCIADWPKDLFRLAVPRLPAALRLPAEASSAPLLSVFWEDLKNILINQVDPRWKTCFA